MSDDHFDGGDLLGLFLLGALLSGQRRPPGHYHGAHWHSHDCPCGNHVHDGHPDGPIRVVPPSPEQIAVEKARRRRRREWWAVALACVAILLGITREPGLMLAFGAAALALSETLRGLIGRSTRALREVWSEREGDPTSRDLNPEPWDETRGKSPNVRVEVVDVRPHLPTPRIPILQPPTVRSERPLGPLTVLSFTARRDGVGDLEVLARIRNNGPSLRYTHVTASALVGERIVAMADVHVWDLAPGEVRSLKLTGNHPYAAHDRIEFQLDDLEPSS